MIAVNELPVVGGLFQAVETYARRARTMARHPIAFFVSLRDIEEGEFKPALKFFEASVIVSYLVCIPWFILSKINSTNGDTTDNLINVSQPMYVIFRLFNMMLIVSLIHLCLIVLAKARSFRLTLVVFFYMAGFFTPIIFAASIPVLLHLSPKVLSSNINFGEAFPHLPTSGTPIVTASAVAFFALGFLNMAGIFVGLKMAHKIGTGRVLIAGTLASLAYLPLYMWVYYPIWSAIEGGVQAAVEFL